MNTSATLRHLVAARDGRGVVGGLAGARISGGNPAAASRQSKRLGAVF